MSKKKLSTQTPVAPVPLQYNTCAVKTVVLSSVPSVPTCFSQTPLSQSVLKLTTVTSAGISESWGCPGSWDVGRLAPKVTVNDDFVGRPQLPLRVRTSHITPTAAVCDLGIYLRRCMLQRPYLPALPCCVSSEAFADQFHVLFTFTFDTDRHSVYLLQSVMNSDSRRVFLSLKNN